MRPSVRFRGAGVALITPFKQDFSIDFEALQRIIEFVIEKGVDYIVALGTTGEAIALSQEEEMEVLRFIVDKVNKRCPIVAGVFGENSTTRLKNKIQNFDFTGFDAIMASSPSYNKPTQEGIFDHFQTVASLSPLPIIIYNVPGRTSSNVEADTILKLANASEKFIGVKEASGDIPQVMRIIKHKPSDFLVLSGDDPLTLSIIGCGGDGAISVIANAYPNLFGLLTNSALAGDFEAAQRMNNLLLDMHPLLYCEGNPAGIKGTMHLLGLCQNVLRLPLKPISESTMRYLKEEMERIKT